MVVTMLIFLVLALGIASLLEAASCGAADVFNAIRFTISGIIALSLGFFLLGIVIGEDSTKEHPKTMTINYEFKDSVYNPVDTIFNNN